MFLQNTSSNNPATMNSQEIADLVQSRHDSVKRTIERLAGKGVIDQPPIEPIERSQLLSPNNKSLAYIFSGEKGRIDSMIVVAQIAPQKLAGVISFFNSIDTALSDILSALNSFDVPDDVIDMYVYAVREKDTGRLKLGISRNPQERLKQLQTGNSSELELVAYKKAGGYSKESAIHKANSEYWIRGEWFSSDASLDKEAV